jgi:hypothetical protein
MIISRLLCQIALTPHSSRRRPGDPAVPNERMEMCRRALVGALVSFLLVTGISSGARAQQPMSAGQSTGQPGWVFNVAPYLWFPTINTTLNYNLPPNLGGRLPTEVSLGPGDLFSNLDFGAMVAGDVRNGPFSLLTDLVYARVSLGASDSHIKSVDFFGLPSIPISRSSQASVSTTLGATIWTLAGGYTVLQGAWGNLDVIAGFRLLALNATTNFNLTVTFAGPRGNGATFGGIGGVSGSQSIWNGIGGIRGRVRLGDTHLFIPYYFDIGAGGSQLTWQISSGLGYQAGWGAVSVVYRYLSFVQGGSALVDHITLKGPLLMANFTF